MSSDRRAKLEDLYKLLAKDATPNPGSVSTAPPPSATMAANNYASLRGSIGSTAGTSRVVTSAPSASYSAQVNVILIDECIEIFRLHF